MRRLAAIIATAILTVAAVIFTVSNLEPVRVNLGPESVAMPLFAALLASLLFGFVIGVLVAWLAGRARRRQMRETARRDAALLRQLDEFRRTAAAAPGVGDPGPVGRVQLVVNR